MKTFQYNLGGKYMYMDELSIEFIKRYRQLSEEMKAATAWLIENIDMVNVLVRGEKIASGEMMKLQEDARIQEQYELLAILIFKEAIDKDRKD